jgi:copper resistance protein C
MTAMPNPRTPARPWLAWVVVAVMTSALPLALAGRPVAAHSILVATSPSAGAEVDEVTEIRLDFAGDIAPDGHDVRATTSGGEVAASGYDRPEPSSLVARFDAGLPPGSVEIVWVVVAADGHQERGRIPFTVTGPPAEGGATGDPEPANGTEVTVDDSPAPPATGSPDRPTDQAGEDTGAEAAAGAEPPSDGSGGTASTIAIAGVGAAAAAAAVIAVRSHRTARR